MEYKIVWRIELDALSPLAAAREALAVQRDMSEATCFEVTNEQGKTWFVDAGMLPSVVRK